MLRRTLPALLFAIAVAGPGAHAIHASSNGVSSATNGMFRTISGTTPHLGTTAILVALRADCCAERTIDVPRPDIVTLIDYSKASTQPRLWVLDVARGRVLFEELVAHGRETGGNFARHFSNNEGSLQSSLGLFLTADTYVGENGYSLRLDGLEPGINDHARERAIVMHGAAYVRAGMEALGRLGRSWGCPALPQAVARQVIDTIKGGSLVVAYYPDAGWLQQSRFLTGCGAATDTVVAN
jgi:hypothetical protein